MSKDKRARKGRKYPRRKAWIERRDAAYARACFHCEVTGEKLYTLVGDLNVDTSELNAQRQWRRACDHIWPERFVRRFCVAADPHVLENLVVITPSLHAKKTAVEWRIFRGDWLGYKQELVRLGFDLDMINRALAAIVKSVPLQELAEMEIKTP